MTSVYGPNAIAGSTGNPANSHTHKKHRERSARMKPPRIIVFCSLFPSAAAPTSGTFIRERMFRVAKRLPIVVVAPQAWSPFDGLVRLFRPSFRPVAIEHETMDGIEVHRPRFFSMPGLLNRLDGHFMAHATLPTVRRIHARFGATLIDAHFLYPDGWAATRIGSALGLPVTITIRGSKDAWLLDTDRLPRLSEAMQAAAKLFAVSESLKRDVPQALGIDPRKVSVIRNGVDLSRFAPIDRTEARRRLGIADDAKVLIGVGNLIPLKGFHRVIPLLSSIRVRHPALLFLIVGGGASQGDMRGELEALARTHGVADIVRFCGRQPHDELKWYYGAADVFAQATAFEGASNVLLEAVACGLPVVTTRVGGNAEIVSDPAVGELVEWWNADAFQQAIERALDRVWDREAILDHARAHGWDAQIDRLVAEFEGLSSAGSTTTV